MNATPHRRPPIPVIIAFGLLVLAPIRLAWFAVEAALDGNWIVTIFAVLFLPLWFLVLRGVWQGGRGAYVIAVVVTILQICTIFGDTASSDPGSSKDAAGQLADNWPALLPAALPVVALLLLVATRPSRVYFARP